MDQLAKATEMTAERKLVRFIAVRAAAWLGTTPVTFNQPTMRMAQTTVKVPGT